MSSLEVAKKNLVSRIWKLVANPSYLANILFEFQRSSEASQYYEWCYLVSNAGSPEAKSLALVEQVYNRNLFTFFRKAFSSAFAASYAEGGVGGIWDATNQLENLRGATVPAATFSRTPGTASALDVWENFFKNATQAICPAPAPSSFVVENPFVAVFSQQEKKTFASWISDPTHPHYREITSTMDKTRTWYNLLSHLRLLNPTIEAYAARISDQYRGTDGRFSPTSDLFRNIAPKYGDMFIENFFKHLLALDNKELSLVVEKCQKDLESKREMIEKKNVEGHSVQSELRTFFLENGIEKDRIETILLAVQSQGTKKVEQLKKWKDTHFEKCGFTIQEIIDVQDALQK